MHVVGGGSKELEHEVGRWALFTYFKGSAFVGVLGFHYELLVASELEANRTCWTPSFQVIAVTASYQVF